MAVEPEFKPVFGPNGAVMNAPSMTAEMRTEHQQEASAKFSILHALPFPLFLAVVMGIQLIFNPPASVAGIVGGLGLLGLMRLWRVKAKAGGGS